jgi:hypothetical protein
LSRATLPSSPEILVLPAVQPDFGYFQRRN